LKLLKHSLQRGGAISFHDLQIWRGGREESRLKAVQATLVQHPGALADLQTAQVGEVRQRGGVAAFEKRAAAQLEGLQVLEVCDVGEEVAVEAVHVLEGKAAQRLRRACETLEPCAWGGDTAGHMSASECGCAATVQGL
jgi:hypothetical protein